MKTWMKCSFGVLFAAVAWCQTPQFPVTPVTPPGTAGLAPVLITALGTGFSSEIVTTVRQQCTYMQQNTPNVMTPIDNNELTMHDGNWDCRTVSGDPRLLMRQGTLLTRSGDTLLASHREVMKNNNVIGTLVDGIDILEENLQSTGTIRNLVRVDAPELSCEASTQAGQYVKTEKGISGFVFNEPLNVMYVETIHSKTYYAATGNTTGSPTSGQVGTCGLRTNNTTPPTNNPGMTPTVPAEIPVMQEVTRTLLRVRGFFDARPVGF